MKEKMADGWFWALLGIFAFVFGGALLGYFADRVQRP